MKKIPLISSLLLLSITFPSISSMINSSEPFPIFVTGFGLRNKEFKVKEGDTILGLKGKIEQVNGMPIQHQVLLSSNNKLNDESTLAECSITKNAHLTLNLNSSFTNRILSPNNIDPGTEIYWGRVVGTVALITVVVVVIGSTVYYAFSYQAPKKKKKKKKAVGEAQIEAPK